MAGWRLSAGGLAPDKDWLLTAACAVLDMVSGVHALYASEACPCFSCSHLTPLLPCLREAILLQAAPRTRQAAALVPAPSIDAARKQDDGEETSSLVRNPLCQFPSAFNRLRDAQLSKPELSPATGAVEPRQMSTAGGGMQQASTSMGCRPAAMPLHAYLSS